MNNLNKEFTVSESLVGTYDFIFLPTYYILCPNWADLSITCSRYGWLNDEWHCSRTSVKEMYWPASACLEILYTNHPRKEFPRIIISQIEHCPRYYWLLACSPSKKYNPLNWIRKMFFPRRTGLSIVTSK